MSVLLTGEANWIIFPEWRMVKEKTAVSKPSFYDLHRGERLNRAWQR